jgi:hypothetical protein
VFNSIDVYEPFAKRWFGRSSYCRASKVDTGSECVSLIADRVRIDHRFNTGALHVSHRRFVDFKPFAPILM